MQRHVLQAKLSDITHQHDVEQAHILLNRASRHTSTGDLHNMAAKESNQQDSQKQLQPMADKIAHVSCNCNLLHLDCC